MTPSRNAPCPCGSGRKYKLCCGAREPSGKGSRPAPGRRSAAPAAPRRVRPPGGARGEAGSAAGEPRTVPGAPARPIPRAFPPPGPEAALRERLVQKLMRFSRPLVTDEERSRAVTRFFGPKGPPEPGALDRFGGNHGELLEITYAEWLLHDFRFADGSTVIERFLKRRGWSLTPAEREHLEKSRCTVLSAYEVAEVMAEEGLVLRDLFRGGTLRVRERSATRYLVRWDVIGARLIELDGVLVISGGVILFARREKEALLRGLAREHARYRKERPGATKEEFLKERGEWLQQFALRRLEQPLPEMVTFDGDPVRFCRGTYQVRDRGAVLEALGAHAELEEQGPGRFSWHEAWDESARGEAPAPQREAPAPQKNAPMPQEEVGSGLLDPGSRWRILGSVEVTEQRLRLETQSEPRLRRLRALVEEAAGEWLAHLADTVQDPWAAIKGMGPRTPDPEQETGGPEATRPETGSLPPEVDAELLREFMDEHYRRWLDEAIPALGGKTPREAVRTKKGRERVAELLRDLENMAARERLEERPGYEVGWLWEELGLEEDR